MSGTNRPARVAEEFAHELSQVLTRGLKDPRITGLVTVTGAKMSPDLKEVTAYVSVLGDERVKGETLEGLRAATPYLQREVGHRLRLRHVPHLRIVFDESIERGDRIETLIKEVHAAEKPSGGEGDEEP